MSAFNTLSITRLVPCSRCGDAGEIRVQFAYGNTQQLHYELGEEIIWGGREVGEPSAGEVQLLGAPEYCRVCGLEVPEEYVISVVDGRLAGYRLATPEDVARLP